MYASWQSDFLCKMALIESRNCRSVDRKGQKRKTQSHRVVVATWREPNPLFSHHKVPMINPHLNQSGILSSTIPRGPVDDKGIAEITENPRNENLWMRPILLILSSGRLSSPNRFTRKLCLEQPVKSLNFTFPKANQPTLPPIEWPWPLSTRLLVKKLCR